MSAWRVHVWSILATTVAFIFFLWVNQEVFTGSAFVRGVNWIFLPSGIRLISTLLVGLDGFLGILIAGLITDFLYWFPHDPVRGIAGAVLGAAAPYLVYRLALKYFDLQAALTNLTPNRLLALAAAYSIANPLFHHIFFFLMGDLHEIVQSFLVMCAGDFAGAVIVLYICKGLLALLPNPARQGGPSGMLRVRFALDAAYENRFR